jgi:hypothetical protein
VKLLAIETSCDETSSAVVDCTDGHYRIDGMSILSQDVHRIFGRARIWQPSAPWQMIRFARQASASTVSMPSE